MKDDNFNLKDKVFVCSISQLPKVSLCSHDKSQFREIRKYFRTKFSKILYERNLRVKRNPYP